MPRDHTFPTISDRVRQHAWLRPDDVAVESEAGRLTWRRLDELADRATAHLAELGVGPGDRIGWLGRNDLPVPVLLIAAARRRAALAGLNWRAADAELADTVAMLDLSLLVTWGDQSARAARAAAAGPPVLALDALSVEPFASAGLEPGAELTPAADDPVLLYLTSGSTGRPKAVVVDRGPNESASFLVMPFQADPQSRALLVPPLFHLAGATWSQHCLVAGACQVLLPAVAPGGLADTIQQRAITHTLLVPTLLRLLIKELEARPELRPVLRHIAYGTAPIDPELLRAGLALLDCGFTQAYGMSEGGTVVSYLTPEDHLPASGQVHLNSAGRPIPGVRVEIADPVSGQRLAAGEVGEIRVRSQYGMRGYWNNPEATAAVLDEQGFLCTKDMGFLDEDGYLHVSGRLDHMIITGGENVFPNEVENLILTMPEVADASVFGAADPLWGQRICAAVVPAAGAPEDLADLVTGYCRDRLAHYKCPAEVLTLTELPRSAVGKILVGSLRDLTKRDEPS